MVPGVVDLGLEAGWEEQENNFSRQISNTLDARRGRRIFLFATPVIGLVPSHLVLLLCERILPTHIAVVVFSVRTHTRDICMVSCALSLCVDLFYRPCMYMCT